ncbi:MAG: hypothetical protein ACKKL6_02620 [Candidatus Komeilibacteria bacterium]
MDTKLSAEEKHAKDISKSVKFAQSNLPFYGTIRLQKNRKINIFNDSIPGLFKAISINETVVHATIESGNQAIGEKEYVLPIEDVSRIEVDRDINRKVILNPELI